VLEQVVSKVLELVGRPGQLRMAGAVHFDEPSQVGSDDRQRTPHIGMMVVENVIDEVADWPGSWIFIACGGGWQFRELVEDRFDGYSGTATHLSERSSPGTAKVDTEALEDCRNAEICCHQVPDSIGFVWMNHEISPFTQIFTSWFLARTEPMSIEKESAGSQRREELAIGEFLAATQKITQFRVRY
jgi:hypothetical protein